MVWPLSVTPSVCLSAAQMSTALMKCEDNIGTRQGHSLLSVLSRLHRFQSSVHLCLCLDPMPSFIFSVLFFFLLLILFMFYLLFTLRVLDVASINPLCDGTTLSQVRGQGQPKLTLCLWLRCNPFS